MMRPDDGQPGRTLVMGILNVTPDSFSDGGRWDRPEVAVAHARQLIVDGADIIDIGGESTRPGSTRPTTEEELHRVLPVVQALAGEVTISVDTMRADVARAVCEAGANIINDVSGGLADPAMLTTVSELDIQYICQHWRGHGSRMNSLANYRDVVGEVIEELSGRVQAAIAAGGEPAKLIVDPGFGFAKTVAQDWTLLANLSAFTALGHRVLIGVSRKRFLSGILPQGRTADERDAATAAVSVICAQQGIWAVRTHDVVLQRDAIAVVQRLKQEGHHD